MMKKLFFVLFVSLLTACGGGGGGDQSNDSNNLDTTPDPIVFSSLSNVPLSSTTTSNTVIISGINADVAVSVSGGEYSINNGMFIATPSTLSNNDQIKVRHTSSGNNNTQTITTLTIGNQSFDFISTTLSSGSNNTTPVANAGPDQSITTGNSIFLDGTGSTDADGDSLTYLWSLDSAPNGSSTTIISETTSAPSLTPDTDGTYIVSLVVNDGIVDSNPDTVSITASSVSNIIPIANAGPDQSITTGNSIFLDGTGSTDADGDSLTYLWSLDSAPNGSSTTIISETTSTPSLTPDTDGTYIVSLVVNDGIADSNPDTVSITASSVSNTAPVANAGTDMIVYVGTTVYLDGSGSSDGDGDTLSFQWTGTSPSGSTATLFNTNTEYPYFTADVIGTFTLNLTVNDGTVYSMQDSVNVTAISLPVSSNIVVYSGNTYLGCWSCNEFNSESIHNSFSQYGSEYGSHSIRNDYGLYGSAYSSTSACNVYASSPPVIIDNNHYYGTMSVNTYNSDSICNQFSSFYSSGDCAILQNYCANP